MRDGLDWREACDRMDHGGFPNAVSLLNHYLHTTSMDDSPHSIGAVRVEGDTTDDICPTRVCVYIADAEGEETSMVVDTLDALRVLDKWYVGTVEQPSDAYCPTELYDALTPR